MGAIRLVQATVVVSLVAVLSMVNDAHAQSPGGGPSGRWEFTTDVLVPAASGRGRGASAPGSATRAVTLNLKVGAGGILGGTVQVSGSGRGGRGAAGTGGNPSRPVEISDGKVDGNHVSFSVWQFDGYKNRMRYDGTADGDRLMVTMTRDTANGPERTQVVAVRKPY